MVGGGGAATAAATCATTLVGVRNHHKTRAPTTKRMAAHTPKQLPYQHPGYRLLCENSGCAGSGSGWVSVDSDRKVHAFMALLTRVVCGCYHGKGICQKEHF